MRRAILLAGLAALAAVPLVSCAADPAAEPVRAIAPPLFGPDGYRIARYRSPVGDDPAPATRITLDEALALEPGRNAIFIDVMPAEGGVRDPASGVWRLRQPHVTIPAALWFPEVGRAPVDAALWGAFEARVQSLRQDAPDQPVVVFCLADCWMSWNASRRLAARGFDKIRWLAEGTDGWHAAGRELAGAEPVVIPTPDQAR